MAHKREGGGAQPKIPEDKQGSNKYEPKIEARLETRPQPGSNKELQRLDDWWLKYSQEREQEQKQELQRKSAEIQNLTTALMREKAERVREEGNVVIYKAIEGIVWDSKARGLVSWLNNHELGLYRLSKEPEFTKVLHEEVEARGLVLEDVAACVMKIYWDLLPPPPSYDRNETIVIRDVDFTPEQRAALVTFMKVQDKWEYPRSWREEISGKGPPVTYRACQLPVTCRTRSSPGVTQQIPQYGATAVPTSLSRAVTWTNAKIPVGPWRPLKYCCPTIPDPKTDGPDP
ncbi:hypothetical protein B9Z19DRAFT_1126746 [Tuber borchii]|uniref:Uncharacterized protein n=1 Tax=Tuber borchii TaxID=42251 RepID=A0A2T6ZSD4_TUBBO|nr:hypothetical protein B9Z19DRAFT_1126746 [Tuber borchii]